ncbi:hypothetical protein M0R45_036487 [Rubus argutus]|uniref:Uncharacterized protein n=1 Tax=Rubus argutus TaxID=59490 RepID=A0AAW1W0B8_RUBAR
MSSNSSCYKSKAALICHRRCCHLRAHESAAIPAPPRHLRRAVDPLPSKPSRLRTKPATQVIVTHLPQSP